MKTSQGRVQVIFLAFLVIFLSSYSHALAGDNGASGPGSAAVPVSPGYPGTTVAIDQSCPTFSWSLAEGAVSYELEVYERNTTDLLPREIMTSMARPIRVREISAPALTWTPSVGECLARGMNYVWYVRGNDAGGIGKWSEPRGFQVEPSALTLEQQEAVRDVVRTYLGEEESKRASAAGVIKDARAAAARPSESQPGARTATGAGGRQAQFIVTPPSLEINPSGARVTGDLIANYLYGNGSGLTGIITSSSSMSDASTPIAVTCTNYEGGTVTINVPSSGVILVEADAWLFLNHQLNTEDKAYIYIGSSATDCANTLDYRSMVAHVPAEYPTSQSHHAVHVMRTFSVASPGQYTYYLNGQMAAGQDASDKFWYSDMRAIFYALEIM